MWCLFRNDLREQNTSREDILREWGRLRLEKRRLRGRGGVCILCNIEGQLWEQWVAVSGGWASAHHRKSLLEVSPAPWWDEPLTERWAPGPKWESVEAKCLLVTDSPKRLSALCSKLGWRKSRHIWFPSVPPQWFYDSPVAWTQAQKWVDGHKAKTSSCPGCLAFHCRYILEGLDGAKSKQNTLCGSNVESSYLLLFLCCGSLCLL